MFNALLYSGLCVTAFAFFPGVDLREIKMTAAIVFALALSVAEIYKHGIKPNKNIWVIFLVAFIPLSVILSPVPQIDLQGIQVRNFWSWYPFLKIVVFSLLFFVISSHEFTKEDLKKLLKVIVWCAFATSLYEMTQFFFTDQFFKQCADGDWGRIAGFIGNPTLTGPFVAMTVPIALYLKNYFKTAILLIGAIIPDGQMGWVALVAGIVVYFSMKGPKWFSLGIIVSLLLSVGFIFEYTTNAHFHGVFNDHERFKQWHYILKDWVGPIAADKGVMNNYSLTGRGLGSFQYVYHVQHADIGKPNMFHQAHNDYIEFGYSCGFIGVWLLFMSIYYMIKNNISIRTIFYIGESGYKRALFSSFVVSAVTASGLFFWQIGTSIFYTIVICGLISNERKLDGDFGGQIIGS